MEAPATVQEIASLTTEPVPPLRVMPTPLAAAPHAPRHFPSPQSLYDKIEAFVSKLSVRDNFWHSICSLLWLPLAFFSGIKMKQIDAKTFAAYLPFRRFNRNWYRAMAGGALLANSEIAGGMYVFGICGGDYTVVCKELNYKFLRPCLGPAVYRMTPARISASISPAVGNSTSPSIWIFRSRASAPASATSASGSASRRFHVTPKVHHKAKAARKAK